MIRRDRPILERMIRAARLEPAVYEEVERDLNATGQAATVVIMASVAAGIGALLSGSIVGLFAAIVGGFVGWIVWSFVTYWVGTTILATPQTRASPGEMLRTLGFSHSPGILAIFTFLPGGLGALVALAIGLWVLVAGVIAVREALDFDTGRAIGTVAIGWLVEFVLVVALRIIF